MASGESLSLSLSLLNGDVSFVLGGGMRANK